MDSSGAAYMRRLQHEPGAAVLDWPFCTAGGNGVGVSNLCLSRPQLLALFAYQRFHEKDVLGGYMGRLHPTQIQPYLDAGFDRMLESSRPEKENACFDLAGWRFFEDFFRLNDFAGINLWVDFLSPSCVAEFHSRFGSPIFRADFAGVGSVEFLPKRPRPSDHIDPERGRHLRLDEY